jgi:crotonobetainyl-CoA:carnitine CoA-transferase CaiB-like acyl-CoA transferase
VALNEAGAPCGPINSIGEGVELAESLGLAPRVELGADGRQVTLVRDPITFGDADLRYELPPPELGEHSDEIKAWLRTLPDAGAAG